jgi:DNA-binding NtrC family response regulator
MSSSEDEVAEVMARLEAQIAGLAPSRATVLLRGGSAEARAAVARALHERSGHSETPLVVVDCKQTDAATLERLLFGGPLDEPAGRGIVHHVGHGTLHVAAIDGLPMLLQPRLLSFLDEARDLRIVGSTAADLAREIREGRLRVDLGERLLLVEIHLPA